MVERHQNRALDVLTHQTTSALAHSIALRRRTSAESVEHEAEEKDGSRSELWSRDPPGNSRPFSPVRTALPLSSTPLLALSGSQLLSSQDSPACAGKPLADAGATGGYLSTLLSSRQQAGSCPDPDKSSMVHAPTRVTGVRDYTRRNEQGSGSFINTSGSPSVVVPGTELSPICEAIVGPRPCRGVAAASTSATRASDTLPLQLPSPLHRRRR